MLMGLLAALAVIALARPVSDGAFDAAEARCDHDARALAAAGVDEADIGGPAGLYEQCMRRETNSDVPLGDGSFWRAP